MTPDCLLQHFDSATLWPAQADGRITAGCADLSEAYRAALEVRRLRQARGECPAGFKIGFTNRSIWDRYRVWAPIWGTVWAGGLADADAAGRCEVSVARLCQPRLEPEIVFGLRATPPARASLEQLWDCVEWLAPGFEVVQSHCPGWHFEASDTVADGGLHGALRIGARRPVRDLAASGAELDEGLGRCEVTLRRDGAVVETGRGDAVLDGPLHALRHFVLDLQACAGAPVLAAGDVVTTGTWTDAWRLAAGQDWTAEFGDAIGAIRLDVRP